MVKLIEEKKTGKDVFKCYELGRGNGVRAQIINYGGRIHRLFISDINGVERDVVIGFNNISEYKGSGGYFNALIGRVGNRIGGAAFELNGKKYRLGANDNGNTLHGGKVGFDSVFWDTDIDGEELVLRYTAADMEEGFPGKLDVEVRYSVTEENELKIKYKAVSDEDTLCSLTNHAYFNLSGDFNNKILGECLKIKSDFITAVDKALIPTGELYPVKNTPLDFNSMKEIGEEISDKNEFLEIAGGYDFNYVLKNDGKSCVAKAFDPKTCIEMEVYTDRPCIQFYSGNFLNGEKGKAVFYKNCAFCLETQGYPNACNIETFPSITLKKGEIYSAETKYKFSLYKAEF